LANRNNKQKKYGIQPIELRYVLITGNLSLILDRKSVPFFANITKDNTTNDMPHTIYTGITISGIRESGMTTMYDMEPKVSKFLIVVFIFIPYMCL
jgi:hypothetical protein